MAGAFSVVTALAWVIGTAVVAAIEACSTAILELGTVLVLMVLLLALLVVAALPSAPPQPARHSAKMPIKFAKPMLFRDSSTGSAGTDDPSSKSDPVLIFGRFSP